MVFRVSQSVTLRLVPDTKSLYISEHRAPECSKLVTPNIDGCWHMHGETAPGAISDVMHGETAPGSSLCISEPGAPGCSELIAPDADSYNVVPTEIAPDATRGGTITESAGVGDEGRNMHSQNAGVTDDGTSEEIDANNKYDRLNQTNERYVVGYSHVTCGETAPGARLCIGEPGAPGCSELIAPDANGYNVGQAETAPDTTRSDTTTAITGIDGKISGVPGKTTGVAGTSNTMQYFLVVDPVENGSVRIEYSPTKDMMISIFAKPGSSFRQLHVIILNVSGRSLSVDAAASQECVGKVASYPYVVRGTHRKNSDVADAVRQPVVTQIG